jgi:hypothetical protein
MRLQGGIVMLRLVVLALMLAFYDPPGAQAQLPLLRVWPDSTPPCNGTLQACINAASPDDTIEIVTNGPIDEAILLFKSVEVQAAPGFQPVFAAGRDIVALPSSGDHLFLIGGLTLAGGVIAIDNGVAGALRVVVRDNRCDGIFVTAATTAPLSFRITDNVVTHAFGWLRGINVEAGWAFGPGDEISGNTVTMAPDNDAIGIRVDAETGPMHVDVVGNRVTGLGYRTGIAFSGAGISEARAVNNLVTGAEPNGYGIAAYGEGTSTNFSIVNNTVTENTRGILVNFANALVANNVVTGNSQTGLAVSNSNTVVNRNNLFFDNGSTGEGPGPNSVLADPLYLDTQAFRPMSGSPVVDAGDDAAVPLAFTTDLDGNPRFDGTVDIGAYEVPEPSPATGTCAALLSLAARCFSRRRTLTPTPPTGSPRGRRSG